MKLRAKHFLLGATTGLIVGTSSFAYVAPERSHDKTALPFVIKQRVIRPETYLDNSTSFNKGLDNLKIARDQISGSIRLLSGHFALPALDETSGPQAFINQALDYVDSHPEVFGLDSKDLRVVNDAIFMDKDVQFVRFQVYRQDLRIADATVNFRFKQGKLVQVVNQSYAEAEIQTQEEVSGLADKVAELTQAKDISRGQEMFRVEAAGKSYRLVKVMSYVVESEFGSLTAQIDTASGKIFEVRDNHYHYDIDVKADTHKRWYNEPLQARDLTNIQVETDQGPIFPSIDAELSYDRTLAAPKLDGLTGRFVKVRALSGTPISEDAQNVNGKWIIHVQKEGNESAWLDKSIAQLMVYYHTNAINERAKDFVTSSWLDKPLTANANLPRTCNAHWDGSTINLYSGDSRCANTGLIADVIYHEWGHGLDAKTGGIDDGAFSEGYGDILSLVMTRSHLLGVGFKVSDQSPVRDLEPDRIYPRDRGEVHSEGLIIGSTFWDLFKALKEKYNEDQATEIIAEYAFKMIFTARTYRDVYDAILVIDDNDSDINNGTPNLCILNEVFNKHGLADKDDNCKLASVESYEIEDDDQDGVIEPGENVSLFIKARNASSRSIDGLSGVLSLTEGNGVEVLKGSLAWDTIPSQSSQISYQPAQLRVDQDAVCGSTFSTKLHLQANGKEAFLSHSFQIGMNAGSTENFAANEVPAPIYDRQTIKVNIDVDGNQWDGNTKVAGARLKFDIDHSYVGDLIVNLISPNGTAVEVFRGRGSSNNVQFDEDISQLVKGQIGTGTWALAIEDKARRDQGQLNSFQLTLTPSRFICD